MTEDRLAFIEKFGIPGRHSHYHKYAVELLREVKRARRSEKVCRAAALIYLKDLKFVSRRKTA